ncbi:K+ transport system, NAD-binding component fusedto Ion channel [Halanaeroarchaeum sp. HSR-CO]|uniref:potassium channel family protein n=1 Tax=Halanaeroarchaeum sp. HSR-CO TaxID=2866382 RepID=UPI00217D841D|nr:NAD-binding protein [Halanaeroarchaeum sp. HSR-CO]UWG48095.1 K+ transport system, NAD-binding component fusedto Ion channel [Halanaeroarchaeum sp. HSR-CO]
MDILPKSFSVGSYSRRNRRVVYYLVGLGVIIGLYTVLYNVGMRVFEDDPRSLFHSLQIVVETMTTTGYGADSPWESPAMNLYIVFMQLTGIAIGFFTLRLIVIPLFSSAEVDLDDRLSPKNDHVIICEYRRDSAVLLDELEDLDIEYVLISSDEENAIDLSNDGYSTIHGSPQEESAFKRASIDSAQAVITDAHEANVDTILTVRSIRPDVEIVALTDDSAMEDVLLDTGADTVLSPHGVLGHRLAEKAVASFDAEIRDAVELGEDLNVSEIPISHDSRLIDKRIRESRIRERTGANVIGAWIDGELQLPPSPDAVIKANTVLLVSGDDAALDELGEFTRRPRTFGEHDRIVLLGMGEVGRAAHSVIEAADIDVTVVDRDDEPGVDIVGDASSRSTLEEAGVADAGAIIVGLPNDSAALLATVLTRSMNPDAEILVRISKAGDTRKALSAGADYVLSVPQVSARMVARELRGEEVLEPASQIRLVQVSAEPFAGKTLAQSRIYETTGCRVVAIEDDDGITSTLDPERVLAARDRLTIVGTDDAMHEFFKRFDVTRPETTEE